MPKDAHEQIHRRMSSNNAWLDPWAVLQALLNPPTTQPPAVQTNSRSEHKATIKHEFDHTTKTQRLVFGFIWDSTKNFSNDIDMIDIDFFL